jgi:hypothetical protein
MSRRTPFVAEGELVAEGRLDVLEARHRIEVVALVVVERGLVTHPPEDGVRVGEDVAVVRVVVDALVGLGSRHVPLACQRSG